MRQILISIQPKWVAKILNGGKTIEIRKTIPKCELPCKVYIYCTKSKPYLYRVDDDNEFETSNELKFEEDCFVKNYNALNGKVVAEFTLNKVTEHKKNFIDFADNKCYNFKVCDVKNAGFDTDVLSLCDFDNFVEWYGKGKPLYAWHIDDLKIYDEPKELSEFVLPNKKNCKTCFLYPNMCNKVCEEIEQHLFRPPQSWCYVEVE